MAKVAFKCQSCFCFAISKPHKSHCQPAYSLKRNHNNTHTHTYIHRYTYSYKYRQLKRLGVVYGLHSQALRNKVEPVLLVALHKSISPVRLELALGSSKKAKIRVFTNEEINTTTTYSHLWQMYCCCYFSNSLNARRE